MAGADEELDGAEAHPVDREPDDDGGGAVVVGAAVGGDADEGVGVPPPAVPGALTRAVWCGVYAMIEDRSLAVAGKCQSGGKIGAGGTKKCCRAWVPVKEVCGS